jgi:hypothetical protein
MLSSDDIKAAVASYFRYVRQFPLVAFESGPDLVSAWRPSNQADILAIDKHRMLYEVEVKISLSDLKANRKKQEHYDYSRGYSHFVHMFYFAVPYDLGNQAKLVISDFFPYAGILTIEGVNDTDVCCTRNPRVLSLQQADLKHLVRMSYNQSGTLCRLAAKVSELKKQTGNMQKSIKELSDELKLYKEKRNGSRINTGRV